MYIYVMITYSVHGIWAPLWGVTCGFLWLRANAAIDSGGSLTWGKDPTDVKTQIWRTRLTVCLFWRTSWTNLSLSYVRLDYVTHSLFSVEFLELLSLWPTSRPSFSQSELAAVFLCWLFSAAAFAFLWSIHKGATLSKRCSNFLKYPPPPLFST